MKARMFREGIALREEKEDYYKTRDIDFIGSYYPDKKNWEKKGFFNLYHGIKENEENSIESLVKIAEDSQAIYEFLQNAVDANADKFFVFYNEKYFAVINNGNKFTQDGIESILNIAQSTKTNDEKRIGKFGVGFKLIHRLVGKSSGLAEIIKEYKGPVLFSWDKTYLSDLLNNNLTNIDDHWLFKIIYTNFPCALGEGIRGSKYEEINPFEQSELNEMIKFVKTKLDESSWNEKDFSTGSLFFLRLGDGKKSLLKDEENNLKMGAEYSLSILNTLYEDKDTVSEMRINNLLIKKKDMEVIKDEKFLLLFPNSQEHSLSYDKTKNEKVSFFKFFPMGDQVNELNFIIHSHLFEIETNRRKIQHSPGNKKLLRDIATRLTKILDELYKNNKDIFYSILLNLYLSDLKRSAGDSVIQENFTNILYDYIKNHIPTINGEIIADASKVKIIKSKLYVPLMRNYEFYFSDHKFDKRIRQKAKQLLHIQEWNILDILIHDDIEDWIHSLTFKEYEVFLFELNEYLNTKIAVIETKKIFLMSDGKYASKQVIEKNNKMFFSGLFKSSIEKKLKKLNFIPTIVNFKNYQNISSSVSKEIKPSFFDDEYSTHQISLILEIFKEENISTFALVKNTKNNYSIIPNEKNISIKDPSFREFLEVTYELEEMGYYLVPEEFESSINEIYNLEKIDNEIKKELLDSNQHREIIDYINTNDLKSYFLDTLNNILLDSSKIYINTSFEYKVLKLISKISTEQYKSKILVDKKSIVHNLKSDKITFRHGRANNEKVKSSQYATEDFDFTGRVENFIEKNNFNENVKSIFKTEEGDKEKVYQYIKDKILTNIHLKNMINTFPRLKYIMMYSLDLRKNLFQDFEGIELVGGEDDTYRSFYNLLDTKISISIDEIVKMNIFTIKDIFKNSLSKNYYISDTSMAIPNEKLPRFFYRSENKKILDTYIKLGLIINSDLENIRKKILEGKEVKQKELTQLIDTELGSKTTLEFLAENDIVIPIDEKNANYKNIRTLYAMAEIENYTSWKYYPVMKTKTELSIEAIAMPHNNIQYITREKLNSSNKTFQKRLTQEIKNELIYSEFLTKNKIPTSWDELKENKGELNKEKEKEILKKDKDISMSMSKTTKGSRESNWFIGWKGEKHVYLLLLDKFENTDLEVIWHNENSKSIEDDKGSIDIEIKDTKGITVHNVEVKTTIKSSNQNQTLAFYMSGGQFDAATSWGRDTHLVFVTGIEDDEPRCLYMNFDNQWLDSNTIS